MASQWHVVGVYRGWRIIHVREYRHGDRVSYYSLETTPELRRKFIDPAYWPVPEFETADDAKAWVDERSPYKLE